MNSIQNYQKVSSVYGLCRLSGKIWAGVLIGFLLGSISPVSAAETIDDIRSAKAVVLSTEDMQAWYGSDYQAWTPSTKDAMKANVAFLMYLEEKKPSLGERVISYNRQFDGILDGEKRLIHINAFCVDVEDERMKQPFMVVDGGKCFMDAIYDVESDEVIEFFVHGES